MKKFIKNIDILTMNEHRPFIRNGLIVVEGNKIKFVGEEAEYKKEVNEKEVFDGKGQLVMPGLINSHCHSSMTLLRGYAGDRKLEDWLFNHILPKEALLNEEMVYWGTLLAVCEMIKSGTTCFADMYLHMDGVARAVSETGIRANLAIDTLRFSKDRKNYFDDKRAKEYIKRWDGKNDGLIKTSMEIHSVYFYDEDKIIQASELAKELDLGVHIHLLETETEKQETVEKYGIDSVRLAERCKIFQNKTFAAHCVHVDPEQMDILKQYDVSVVHNPTSNLKLASGIANVPLMLEKGINVALGTDGTASNNNLNMFEEINLAALIHKGATKDATVVKTHDALKMATVNGAKAIGFENEIGCVKEGYRADLIFIDMNKPHLTPKLDIEGLLTYSCQAADVDSVMVNGKVLMKNRKLLFLDEGLIMNKVNEIIKEKLFN